MARRTYPKEALQLGSQPPAAPANAFTNPLSQPYQPPTNQTTTQPTVPTFQPVATATPFYNPNAGAFSNPGVVPQNFNPGFVPTTTGPAPTVPITYATATPVTAPPALDPLPMVIPQAVSQTPIQTPLVPITSQPPVSSGPRHAPPPVAGAAPPISTPPPLGGIQGVSGAPGVPGNVPLTQPPPPAGTTAPAPSIGKRPIAYPETNKPAFGPTPTYGDSFSPTAATGARPVAQTQNVTGSAPEPNPAWAPDKRYVRTTLESWPATNELLDKTGLPWGISFHPLANTEIPVPVVNFGECNIVRCKVCRAYVNPYVTFVEGGKRWRCNLCYYLNDVPREYFSMVGNNGLRYDHNERLELNHSVVEFVASSEFMNRPPQPPVFFFLIDVSYTAVVSGMVRSVCNAIYQAIDKHLSTNKRTKIGFLTFDTALHYYNLRPSLSSPQMLVMPEIDNPVQLPTQDFLVNLSDSRHLVDKLLKDLLPNLFQQGQDNNSALGSALRGAFQVCSPQGGKIVLFQSVLPSVGVGKLPVRDTSTNDPTGRQLMQPGEQFYKNLALEFAKVQLSCDLFCFTPKYIDVATIGCLAKYTGGDINYYHLNQFSANEAARLQNDVYRNLTRNTGYEALMRVRCTAGLATDSHHGSFFLRAPDLFNLPTVDSDKAFTMKVKVSDAKALMSEKNLARDGKYYATIQAGLLYTTSQGERRIRIITKCCPITMQPSELFKSADQYAAVQLIANLALTKAFDEGIPKAIIAIKNACAHTLTQYSLTCAPGQGVNLPYELAAFPLYCLAVIKNAMFRSDVSIDERVSAIRRFETLSVNNAMLTVYPSLYNLSNLAPEAGVLTEPFVMPPQLELSVEKLNQQSVFLLDNGQAFYLWVGSQTPPDVLRNLFNIESLQQVDPSNSQLQLIRLENDLSQRVNNIVDRLRRGRSGYTWLYALKEKDPTERKFFSQLVQDRFPDSNSYREFVVELRNIVSQRSGGR